MKELLIELRMLIAEKLLGWCFDVSPNTSEGNKLKYLIGHYFETKVNEQKFNQQKKK